MKRIRLTRKGFREWLERIPGDACVGYPGHPRQCPVARYLCYIDVELPEVERDTFKPFWGKPRPLPKWAKRFVKEIDYAPDIITARQALAVLDGKDKADA